MLIPLFAAVLILAQVLAPCSRGGTDVANVPTTIPVLCSPWPCLYLLSFLAIDQVGATNCMRLKAVAKDGRVARLKYGHRDLEVCVGIATAAFAAATLRGDVSVVDC